MFAYSELVICIFITHKIPSGPETNDLFDVLAASCLSSCD